MGQHHSLILSMSSHWTTLCLTWQKWKMWASGAQCGMRHVKSLQDLQTIDKDRKKIKADPVCQPADGSPPDNSNSASSHTTAHRGRHQMNHLRHHLAMQCNAPHRNSSMRNRQYAKRLLIQVPPVYMHQVVELLNISVRARMPWWAKCFRIYDSVFMMTY